MKKQFLEEEFNFPFDFSKFVEDYKEQRMDYLVEL